MQRVIIYARKSTEQEDRQLLSIDAQLRELNSYAAKAQLHIVASLREARTARKPGREVFAHMVESIEQGKADAILAWHPDRLARNSVDGGKIIHLLDTGQLKQLYFPTLTFENNPQGKFMLSIAFSQSKYYVDNLSENVKRGMREKVLRGEWTWPAPLGYVNNRETRTIELDPAKAPLIRRAFELYSTGNYTFQSLRDELTRQGLRTRKEKVLPVSNVQKLLMHHAYYGMISMNGELFPGAFNPIVSKKLFDEVQRVMAEKSKPRRKRKHSFPFTGWLKCHSCGCSITAQKQKGHHYYHCTKKRDHCEQKPYVREETILEQAREVVEQLSLPDDWCEKMLQKLDTEDLQASSDHRAGVQHLEEEKREIDAKLDKLLDLRLEGALDNAEYLCKKNALVSRKADIDEEIGDAERNQTNWVEPMRELIIASREAKKLLTTENLSEIPPFLKTAGLNWVLKGTAVQWDAKNEWRALAKSHRFRGWWS